jgi:hypothetical protein
MSLSDYQLSYQVSPIILVGGIAGTGMLPIVSLLSSQSFDTGLLSSSSPQQIADYFGQFRPLPGHTLMDNEVATYPVANQVVAANAIITNPLRVSLEMLVPANGIITVSNKLSIITALKSSLDSHTAQGGWYNVATPSYIYQGCLLLNLTDASDEEDGAQVQVRWVWNFFQPLLTVAAAQAAQNQQMASISAQTAAGAGVTGGQPIAVGVGQPSANIVQNLVPAAAGPIGSNLAPGGTPSLSSVSPVAPTLLGAQ